MVRFQWISMFKLVEPPLGPLKMLCLKLQLRCLIWLFWFVQFSSAWIFRDHFEPLLHEWCKGVSEIFTRGAFGESYRDCFWGCGEPWASQTINSREWRCTCRWEAARIDGVTRWPDCKNLLPLPFLPVIWGYLKQFGRLVNGLRRCLCYYLTH